jgi:hypothetical protein
MCCIHTGGGGGGGGATAVGYNSYRRPDGPRGADVAGQQPSPTQGILGCPGAADGSRSGRSISSSASTHPGTPRPPRNPTADLRLYPAFFHRSDSHQNTCCFRCSNGDRDSRRRCARGRGADAHMHQVADTGALYREIDAIHMVTPPRVSRSAPPPFATMLSLPLLLCSENMLLHC